jgi:YHS domain-containing protein
VPIVNDPVCGKEVDTDAVNSHVDRTTSGAPESDPSKGTKRFHEGVWYYFDSLACRMRFVSNPDEYVSN